LRAVHTLIRRMPAAKKGRGKAKPSKAAVRAFASWARSPCAAQGREESQDRGQGALAVDRSEDAMLGALRLRSYRASAFLS